METAKMEITIPYKPSIKLYYSFLRFQCLLFLSLHYKTLFFCGVYTVLSSVGRMSTIEFLPKNKQNQNSPSIVF